MDNNSGALIIGYDFSNDEGHVRDTLVVMKGSERGTPTKIVNVFYDEEARLMYEQLTKTVKEVSPL